MNERRIIVGNWKMNPGTLAEARKLFQALAKGASLLKQVEVVVCPPMLYLPLLKAGYSGKKITFGGQNVHHENLGAHTGEVSAQMLKSVGASFCIVGHSERRAFGEDNASVAKKVGRTIETGMTAIVCVGERERDNGGAYLSFLREQVKSALISVTRSQFEKIIVAYEPLWAIGKTAKDAMKAEDIHSSVIFIRKTIAEFASIEIAHATPVLYGGSVEAANAFDMVQNAFVDGFLVGHASLRASEFIEIATILSRSGATR